MFPARAGMSRARVIWIFQTVNVPRASGDEPMRERAARGRDKCSPRERG